MSSESLRQIAQKTDPVDLDQRIEQRIDQREQEQASRGLLSEFFYDLSHVVSRADEQSLARLKDLRDGKSAGDGEQALSAEQSATAWRNETAQYAATFVKAVPLFMGRRGFELSAAANGLDQVREGTPIQTMALDFTVGAVKGVALKFGMDRIASSSMATPYKGVILGGGSGFLDSALAVRTWYDPNSGDFHVKDGLLRTAESTTIGAGVGVVAFPLGAKLANTMTPAVKASLGGRFSSSVLNGMVTGWSFGATSGATAETVRQVQAGETINPVKIASRALAEGSTTMFAGGVGARLGGLAPSRFGAPDRIEARPQLDTESRRTQWLRQQPNRILDVASKLAQGEPVPEQMLAAVSENPEIAKSIDNTQIRPFIRSQLLSNDPVAGLDFLMNTGAMKQMLPEVAEMTGPRSAQDPKYHPEGNVWQHVKLVLGEHVARTENLPEEQKYTERLAALLHDIAKPETQNIWPDGGISNYKHADIGAQKAQDILQRLGEKPETIEQVSSIIKDHMRMHEARKFDESTLNELLADPLIEAKIRLQASDALGSGNPNRSSRALEPFLSEKLAEYKAKEEAKAQMQKPILTGDALSPGGTPTVLMTAGGLGVSKLVSRLPRPKFTTLTEQSNVIELEPPFVAASRKARAVLPGFRQMPTSEGGNLKLMPNGFAELVDDAGVKNKLAYWSVGDGGFMLYRTGLGPAETSSTFKYFSAKPSKITIGDATWLDWKQLAPTEIATASEAIPKGSIPVGFGTVRQAWLTPAEEIVVLGPVQDRVDCPYLLKPFRKTIVGTRQIEWFPYGENHSITSAEVSAFDARVRSEGWSTSDHKITNYIRLRDRSMWIVDPEAVGR
jgi:putative nucleotidyltransferase with HDIG domain